MITQTVTVLPHPPEFLSCYEDKLDSTDTNKTKDIYKEQLKGFFNAKPATIVVIQSHGGIHPEGISFHLPDGQQYDADFSDFGYPDKNFSAVFDQSLAHYMQKSLHEYGRKSHVINQQSLSLPALVLTDMIIQLGMSIPRIVVVGVSLEGSHAHYEYGSLLARAISADKDPVAVVVSGQLSHCLTKESVAGYVPIAKNYDKQVQGFLESSDWEKYMNIDPFEIQEVGEDAYRPIAVGMGMLGALENEVKWTTTSYEAPHGIGYLCGRMEKI